LGMMLKADCEKPDKVPIKNRKNRNGRVIREYKWLFALKIRYQVVKMVSNDARHRQNVDHG
jgi:hypothetical protein